jgi:hypothetical protein
MTAVLTTISLAGTIWAADLRFEEVGLVFTVPDTWSHESDAELTVAESSDGSAAVLFISPAEGSDPGVTSLDDVLAGMFEEAEEIGERAPLEGVEGISTEGSGVLLDEEAGPTTVAWAAMAIHHGGHDLYVVGIVDLGGDQARALEVDQIFDSATLLAMPGAAGDTSDGAASDTSESATQPSAGAGFLVAIEAPSNRDLQRYQTLLEESNVVRDIVDSLNASLILPRPVTIRVTEGDGPVYYPDTNEIIMSYEFLADTEALFRQTDSSVSDEDIQLALLDVFEWVLYHEVGHALVANYDLPIVGREEDAVDSLAAVISLAFIEGGDQLAFSAAELWIASADSREVEEEDFWDAHSLDLQRFTAIVCWLVGSNPEANADLIADFEFDEERVAGCELDFEQQVNAWETLLAPYMRP